VAVESAGERFQTLHEFIAVAHSNLTRNIWDYLVGGTETETTLARNRQALDSLALRPRVLCDVADIDLSVTLLGKRLRIPVLCAPVGSLEVFEANGAATVAAAADSFGIGMLLSSVSQPGLEATAAAGGDALKIFQLYVRGDSAWVDDYFRRAIDAGYDALCLTVDSAYYSRRERDLAKRFFRWRGAMEGRTYQPRVTWRDVDRYKSKFKLPLVLKGIASAEDAALAIEHGVEIVYVSNHGGRQLDHGQGTMEILPEVVAAVGGRARIVVDGGISRGTDIVKALALGADAVGIGRLYVYGLAAAGAGGVVRVLELLEEELRLAMGLLGVTRPAALTPAYLRAASPTTAPGVHSAFPLLTLPPWRY